MTTRRLLLIFALLIEALAPLGCGSQIQPPSNITQGPNKILVHPLSDANDIAADIELPPVADATSYGAQEHTAQFALPNSRQHVLSSGFPGRDY
jgi:hypothetical protein